jgi:hypothetical protein
MLQEITPDSLTWTGSDKLHPLGEEYCHNGVTYEYGQYEHSASVTCHGKQLVFRFSSSGTYNQWTADYSDAVLADVGYVGVAMGSHGATTSYGWFAKSGAVTCEQGTTEAIVDGDYLQLKGDKQPTKCPDASPTTPGMIDEFKKFGMARQDFSTVTSSLKRRIRLDN